MNTDYQMWLTFNGEKEKLRFPVLPAAIDVSQGSNNKKIVLAELGEVTVIQGRKEASISFSSFFPAASFQGGSVSAAPAALKNTILAWKSSRKPVHFIVTGHVIDMYATIDSFQYSENGGDVGTLHYSITLDEYREINVRQVRVSALTKTATVSRNAVRLDNTVVPKTYTVKTGDSLWSIAKKYLGSGSKYTDIYNINKDIIKNPALIYQGQVLKMPS